MLRHDNVRAFASFCVLVFVRAIFCYGALKLDISTWLTTFFLLTSLQFILTLFYHKTDDLRYLCTTLLQDQKLSTTVEPVFNAGQGK